MQLASFVIILFVSLSTASLSQPTDKNFLIGKTDYTIDPRFVRLRDEHTTGSAKGGYLLKEVYEGFVKMSEAAKKNNITLKIAASARAFDVQKTIWESKWNGKTLVGGINMTTVSDAVTRATKILRSSSLPGTSRYHWGTDIAINSMDEAYFQKQEGVAVYKWLNSEAARYGFCQPYNSKINGRTGYEEAKWQWSYLPKAEMFLKDYVRMITLSDINGFAGSETASKLKIIEQYVQGVECTDLLVKFINDSGKEGVKGLRSIVINPDVYIEILDYSEGLIAVKNKSGWGFADTIGKIVIPCQFSAVSSFENGRAVVCTKCAAEDWQLGYHYLDAKGNDLGNFFKSAKGKIECQTVSLIGSSESSERHSSYYLSNCPDGKMKFVYNGLEWGNDITFYPSTTIKDVITTMANALGEYSPALKKFKGENTTFQEGDSKVAIIVLKNNEGVYQSVKINFSSEYRDSSLSFSLEKGGVLLRNEY